MSKFIDRLKLGSESIESLDSYIEEWHTGDSSESLQEYLGMNDKEYQRLVIAGGKNINGSPYKIKVTTINNRFHARLFNGDYLIDEMACEEKADIGYICRSMMRWTDKGGGDQFTHASRMRRNSDFDVKELRGRIWHRNQL